MLSPKVQLLLPVYCFLSDAIALTHHPLYLPRQLLQSKFVSLIPAWLNPVLLNPTWPRLRFNFLYYVLIITESKPIITNSVYDQRLSLIEMTTPLMPRRNGSEDWPSLRNWRDFIGPDLRLIRMSCDQESEGGIPPCLFGILRDGMSSLFSRLPNSHLLISYGHRCFNRYLLTICLEEP